MTTDTLTIRDIVDAANDAWCRGDVEGVLEQYVEDLTYWSNVGNYDGSALTLIGKPALRTLLQSLHATLEGSTVTEHFQVRDGVARALIGFYIRHRQTGLILSGTYRQVMTFRENKIERIEQYHDGARTSAFWRLVAREMNLA